jgi:hypothetical protein
VGTKLGLNECGLACSVCWGADKAFGELCTPKYVKLVFSGIHVGSAWYAAGYPDPNQTYLCVCEGSACYWEHTDFPISAFWSLSAGGSMAYLSIQTIPLFQKQVTDICIRDFENMWHNPGSPNELGGKCSVFWDTEGLK